MFIVPENIILEYKTNIDTLPMNEYKNYQDGQYILFNGNCQTSVCVKIVDNKFNIIHPLSLINLSQNGPILFP